jgi:hypothetical protein
VLFRRVPAGFYSADDGIWEYHVQPASNHLQRLQVAYEEGPLTTIALMAEMPVMVIATTALSQSSRISIIHPKWQQAY